MERNKLEEISHTMVNRIVDNNCVTLDPGQKDILMSVCSEAIIMGYQLGYGEILENVKTQLNSLAGISGK